MRSLMRSCVRAVRSSGSSSAALPSTPYFMRSRRLSSMTPWSGRAAGLESVIWADLLPLHAPSGAGSARRSAAGEDEVAEAVGDLLRRQPAPWPVPLRGVVDHAEQRELREPAVGECVARLALAAREHVVEEALEALAARAD